MTKSITSPLVSIGMPVYNGERFIRKALDSLLCQTYENFELIISDNGSTDRTHEICLEYSIKDKRVRYYRNEINMGAAWNFTRVFELSSAEYFMWSSHDDGWDPRYIKSCIEAFNMSDDIILVGTACESIDPETEKVIFTDRGFSTIGIKPDSRFMLYKSNIHGGRHIGGIFYGLYKRSVLSNAMPMKKVVATDHLILAELCFYGEFVTIQENLMFKRWGGASTSHKNNAQALGLNNKLFIMCPYLVREILLQKMIFHTDKLTMPEKIRLSCWSLVNYIKDCLIKDTIYSTYNYLKTLK